MTTALACLIIVGATAMVPVIAAAGPVPSSSAAVANGVSTVQASGLYDDFSRLNTNMWSVRTGSGPHSTKLLSNNVAINSGKLVISGDTKALTGGKYQTTSPYSYGLYQFSAKLNLVPGMRMDLFTYSTSNGGSQIDYTFYTQSGKNYLYFATTSNGRTTSYTYTLPFNPSTSYHTYGFNWASGKVQFYVDDMTRPVWTSTSNVPSVSSYMNLVSWIYNSPSQTVTKGSASFDWFSIGTASAAPTVAPTATPTATPKPTSTPTPTPTVKPTATPTSTPTPTPAAKPSAAPTATPTATPKPTSTPTPTPTVTPTPGGTPKGSKFFDDFKPHNASWEVRDSKGSYWNNGFANCTFKPGNVNYDTANGLVELSTCRSGMNGAEISTDNNYMVKYGNISCRAALQQSSGTCLAPCWVYWWGGSPYPKNEIDIEMYKDNATWSYVMFSLYKPGTSGNSNAVHYTVYLQDSVFHPEQYHVYKINWQPTYVDFYIDDKLYWHCANTAYIANNYVALESQAWTRVSAGSAPGDSHMYIDWYACDANGDPN